MEKRERFFIYDRREMGVLLVLGLMVALFAFTLGVHLGKKVGPKETIAGAGPTAAAEMAKDAIPNRQELAEQMKGADQAAEDSLDTVLHEEVVRSGIRMNVVRQVELPDAAKSKNGGATSPRGMEIPALTRPMPPGAFTIQVGSYPVIDEARQLVDALEAVGLTPVLRAADLKEKGTWFRVYLGGFDTREEAETAGSRYVTQHVVDSFVVTNSP